MVNCRHVGKEVLFASRTGTDYCSFFPSRAVENPGKYKLRDLVTDKGKPLRNSTANQLSVVIKNMNAFNSVCIKALKTGRFYIFPHFFFKDLNLKESKPCI